MMDEQNVSILNVAFLAVISLFIYFAQMQIDPGGRKSYNNAVSEARAKAVRDYLISSGLDESRLSVTWLKPPQPQNEAEREKKINRRVVVNII